MTAERSKGPKAVLTASTVCAFELDAADLGPKLLHVRLDLQRTLAHCTLQLVLTLLQPKSEQARRSRGGLKEHQRNLVVVFQCCAGLLTIGHCRRAH